MLTRAELLGQIMKNYGTSIAVSGTHGKTTTTSMVSHILLEGKCDPTISVGGILPAIHGNIRVGHSDTFVTEACEYTNSFLSFFPTVAIILNMDADYVYICENNTIYGTKYKQLPNTKGKLLVSDVSSCFLSEPMDISKYGYVYGGVQKNVGPAGVVVGIMREDLITESCYPNTPTMLRYKTYADNGSMYNTPPCYNIYICGKVFKWLLNQGGLEVMQQRNEEKAKVLYDYLDSSKLFVGTVEKKDRSLMNVPFVTGSDELNAKFVKEAEAAGLTNLKGHRSVGGMRASIYNAMPKAGVEKLVEFMADFEEKNK